MLATTVNHPAGCDLSGAEADPVNRHDRSTAHYSKGMVGCRGEYGSSMSIAAAPPVDSMFLVPRRMPALPPAREFVTSAGFGGAAALVAALLLAGVALIALMRASKRHRLELEQQESHSQQVRNEQQRTAAVQRCWERLVWVVETAGIEPASQTATVGLGPQLALELLRGLLRDAEDLDDQTLRDAVRAYLNEFSLVLSQQTNALPTPIGAPDPAPAADHHEQPVPEAQAMQSAPTTNTVDAPGPAKKVAVTGRRRRQ